MTPVSVNIRKLIKNDYSDFTGLSHRELATEYGELDGKYRKLRRQTEDLVQANETLQLELRERTKTTYSWKEYATRQKECAEKRRGQIKRLKEELAAATNVALDCSSTSDTNPNSPDQQLPDVDAQNALRTGHLPSVEPLAQNDGSALFQCGKSPNGLDGEYGTPSNRGDGQVAEEPVLPPLPVTDGSKVADAPIKDEPSSDAPVVVSERPVRRRNEGNSSLKDPAVTRVKIEEGSDPAVTDEQCNFVPHESIDFDDGEDSLSTPRRNLNSHQTSTATTLVRGPTPRDGLLHTEELPHNLTSSSSPAGTEHVSMKAHPRRSAGHRANDFAVSNSNGRDPTLLRGIASLAEDEDRVDSIERPRQTFRTTGRLDSLLKTASPEKQTIRVPPNALRVKAKALTVSETPSTKILKRTSTAIQPKPQAPDTIERSKRRRRNLLRLRDRPQSSLSLGDFKINPKHNDGLDYAFSEVVRNKEDRLCLPGCVKEECCAPGFRNQARGERLQTGAIAFQSLLEDWLGDEAWRLSSMDEDEKEALWLKAKTQQVANEYGKSHRHRVQRATTPPGYFNVDFPSTQQLNEDNQLTAVMQRERIEERYREAMKPNQTGRWLFRDE